MNIHKQKFRKPFIIILFVLFCLFFPTFTTLALHRDSANHSSPSKKEATPTTAPVMATVNSEDSNQIVVYSNEVFASLINRLLQNHSVSSESPLETLQIVDRDDNGNITSMQIANESIDIHAFTQLFELTSACIDITQHNGGIRIITYTADNPFKQQNSTLQ